MANKSPAIVDQYIVTLRIIQPARIQDIIDMFGKIWNVEIDDSLRARLTETHGFMRSKRLLVDVRKGTYVLNKEGMEVAAGLLKERDIDNARIFLMKRQRRSYHRLARRLG